eukprot:991655_1
MLLTSNTKSRAQPTWITIIITTFVFSFLIVQVLLVFNDNVQISTKLISQIRMNATNQTKEQYECHHDGKTNVSTLYEELETMYRWMIFSQVRQDSILETIFSYIGTTNKFCVEFGVDNNANLGGNTLLLAKKGWNSLLLDGNQDSAHMNLHKEWISRLTINSIFDKYNVPENPDYVSIDIDSCDLWVFLAITN